MRIYRPIIFLLAAILLFSEQAFSQACAPAYVGYTATTSCLTGYYSNGCQVSFGGHNYTAQNGPHFNITPPNTAYWVDNGTCGSGPVPTITTTGTLSAFSTTYGVASASQSFNVSGVNMTAGILVTPPTGFEVSLSSGGTYTATVTVGAAGTIASTPVYVRLKAIAAASTTLYNSKNIVMTSSGATTVNISTTASSNTVNKATLTITAGNQAVCYGTAVATVTAASTYTPTGFVNGETASVISGSPSYTTTYTATTAAGTAGVTITPAINTLAATNYSFTFAAGTVTVNATPAAPTTTTPVNYCQNATATPLTATGSNLLWYSGGGSTTTNFYTSAPATVSGFSGNNYKWNFTVLSAVTINSINIKGAGAGATGVQVTIFNASNVSQGATNTASVGASTVQTFTFSGGIALAPGSYYFSMNSGSGSANILVFTGTDISADQSDGRLTYPNSNTGGNSGNKGPYYNVNYTYGSSTTSSTAPTPVTSTVGATTYNVTQTVSGCESPKTLITVNIIAPTAGITTWSGATNTDWATVTNWGCSGIPTSSLDASIPTGMSRYPVINASATAKSVSIANGASLTLTGAPLTVYGDWTNTGTGTFTADSTVIFAGTTSNTISGTAPTTFYNITINKTSAATITVSGTINLLNKLSFGTSAVNTLTISGSFTFKSTASKTAHIDVLAAPLPVLSGSFTCEKYFPSQTSRYNFMLGVPITNGTMASLKATTFDGSGYPTNGLLISGPFTGTSTATGLNLNNSSSFQYNATSGLYTAYPISGGNITSAMTAGKGYRFSVRDNGSATAVVAKTLSVTGTLATPGPFTYTGLANGTGTKPFNSSALPTAASTGGWNLISNPYMSDISINLSSSTYWTKTNVSNTSYIYNAATRTYLSCASGVPATSCTVAPFQGFFIQTTGAPSLQINEAAKIAATNNAAIKRVEQKAVLNYLTIKLTSSKSTDPDFTYIRYIKGAGAKYDTYDGLKLGAAVRTYVTELGVYTAGSDNNFYDVNAKAYDFKTDTTVMHIVSPVGDNTLNFSDISNLETGYAISLYDKFTKQLTNVSATPIYKFTVTTDTNSTGARFKVIVNRASAITDIEDVLENSASGIVIYPSPTYASNFNIATYGKKEETATVYIYDMMGRQIYTTSLKITVGKNIQSYDLSGVLESGMYTTIVKSADNNYSQKIIIK